MDETQGQDAPDNNWINIPDDTLLQEIRETYNDYVQQWAEIRKQGDLDMQALSVEGQWTEKERKQREKDNRPIEHIDIISQYNKRVVNQARLNKRGIKVAPKGEGADDKTAERRENRIREIEYESKASRARLTALQSATDRGEGYYRVRTDYIDPRSFNQRIIIDRIPNSQSVLVDPYCKEADFSDQQKSFIVDRLAAADYFRRFKRKANGEPALRSFNAEQLNLASAWLNDKSVMLAEFWKIHKREAQLVSIQLPEQKPITMFAHEIQKLEPTARIENDHVLLGGQWWPITNQRESEECQVMQYFTNGLEILDRKEWTGSTIPIMVVIGYEKYENDKRVIESMTRKQRSAQKAFDVAHNRQLEAMLAQSKYIIAEGQLEGHEEEWKLAHLSPYPYVSYKAVTDGTGEAFLPPPTREDYIPQVAPLELVKDSALRSAQNAIGMTSAERKDRSAKSGIAQERMDEAGDIASFHMTDNLDLAIEYEARVVNELLDKIEDSERIVGMRMPDDSYKPELIQPTADAHPYGPSASHGLTVSVGQSYQSQRDEASQFAETLTKLDPEIFRAIAPLVVKLKNLGPVGDEIMKLLEFLQPPDIRAMKNGQQPIPPEVQQQMAQMQQALGLAQQQIQQLLQELDTKKYEIDSKERIEAMKGELKKLEILTNKAIEEMKIRAGLLETHEQLTSAEELHQSETQAEVQIQQLTHEQNLEAQEQQQLNVAAAPAPQPAG
jgi:hypothetical protein